jgi:hypothetical protein
MSYNQNNQNNTHIPSVSSIPNLEELTSKLLEFIEFVDSPEIVKMRKTNMGNFNYIVNEKFKMLPLSMVKLLSDTEHRAENLEKILDMITILKSVKQGEKTFETAENEFVEKRAEEYLYPAFGGKDNFYKVAEENKKKQEQSK